MQNKNQSSIRRIFSSIGSSTATIVISIGIIVVAAIFFAVFFSRSIEAFIIEQKTNIIFDTVSNRGTKHFNSPEGILAISSWETPESKKFFEGWGDDLLQSLHMVPAIKLFTPDGFFIWTNLPDTQVGGNKDAEEIAEVISKGKLMGGASASTMAKLKTESLLEFFVPVKNESGASVVVVEAYFDTSDITLFIQKFRILLGSIIVTALIALFFFLRFNFRRQDTKILSQAKELQNIVEQAPLGIYTVNKDSIIETFNPAMVKISGIEDAIGKNIFEMNFCKNTEIHTLIREGLAGVASERECVSSDENKRQYSYRSIPLTKIDGSFAHLLVLVEDITERKVHDEEVKNYTNKLKEEVSDRTKKLTEKLADLEQFQRLMVGREVKMSELKQEIEKMRAKLESLGVKTDAA